MFDHKYNRKLSVVFFCALGLGYSGPVTAQSQADQANADSAASQPRPSVFESTESDLPDGQAVKVGSFDRIDIAVQNLEVSKVLQLLSIQSQRNIIVSRNVSGTVSAQLYQVDFYDALDAILQPNGFGFREKGNFIYVHTAQELEAIKAAERKQVVEVVRLKYLNATDAATFVSPMLSASGSISVNGDATPSFQPSLSDGGAKSYALSDVLVIKDYPEQIQGIKDKLKEIDLKPMQIQIEATVLEAKLTEANAFGVDIAAFADFKSGAFAPSGVLNSVNQLISGTVTEQGGTLGTDTGGSSGPAGIRIGVLADEIAIFIKALDQVTDTTVVANPKLLVLNRQKADLLVGDRIGYISTTATESSTTQSVEFLDTGTQLTVRPFATYDDQLGVNTIRMEVRPSISTGSVSEIAGFVVPNETTESLTTNVIVRDGQTVVLGGLFKETTTITRKQVPGLGDVPIVGAAFKGQDDSINRSEFIFMVTPSVVKDELIARQGKDAHRATDLARLGARDGLLPWSRTRQTTSYVQEAMDHLEGGDRDKALMAVNKALNLDKHLTEARQLREKITGENEQLKPTLSILRNAVDQMVDEAAPAGVGRTEPDKALPSTTSVKGQPADETNTIEENGVKVNTSYIEPGQPSGQEPAAPTAADKVEAAAAPVLEPTKATATTEQSAAPATTPAPAPTIDVAPEAVEEDAELDAATPEADSSVTADQAEMFGTTEDAGSFAERLGSTFEVEPEADTDPVASAGATEQAEADAAEAAADAEFEAFLKQYEAEQQAAGQAETEVEAEAPATEQTVEVPTNSDAVDVIEALSKWMPGADKKQTNKAGNQD